MLHEYNDLMVSFNIKPFIVHSTLSYGYIKTSTQSHIIIHYDINLQCQFSYTVIIHKRGNAMYQCEHIERTKSTG